MGHPGLEPEVVFTIQPAVPYLSPKGEAFCLTQKRPSTKGVIPCTPIVLTPTHDAVRHGRQIFRSFSGGYRYFCAVGNPTGRIQLNENTKKTRPHAAVKRDIRESNPETTYAASTLSLPGVTPERKQISKGFSASR